MNRPQWCRVATAILVFCTVFPVGCADSTHPMRQSAASRAQEDVTPVVDPHWSRSVGHPLLVDSLPKHVVAPEGQLTLYADYTDTARDREVVRLYLVNRTGHTVGLDSIDGDAYVKLEAMTSPDVWERAQTHSSIVECGNSLFVVSLGPGEYFRFAASFPSKGEEHPVRFRMYRESAYLLPEGTPAILEWSSSKRDLEKMPVHLVSNVGLGRARLEAIETARHDGLTIQFGTFESLRNLALGVSHAEGLGGSRGRPSKHWHVSQRRMH